MGSSHNSSLIFKKINVKRTQRITRRCFLHSMAMATGVGTTLQLGFADARVQVAQVPSQQQRIEAAIPAKAFVWPNKPRKLLIFDLNVGYGGHRSISTANLAFKMTGEKTGTFETVISKDPSVFKPESLVNFDAVFLNNTVGNLFEDSDLRQSLIEFVYSGGGLMGVHGTTVAFTRWPGAHEAWPEFGIMLGARGANHRDSNEHVFIKLDDPNHPLNQTFGGEGFDYRDEFFRVHGPYSRQRVRVLLSIDSDKTDINQGRSRGNCYREDNDYALAWVRQYGRGRIFYCTIAHNPYVFWDSKILQFYLAATQFVLGDLSAPTIPSGKLTPAIRAQEILGWRLGLSPPACGDITLFEAIDKTAKLGLLYTGGCNLQMVSDSISKNFGERLGNDELRHIRLKLDAAGVRLLTYRIDTMPSDEKGFCRLFKFGRKMGIETFVAQPPLNLLNAIEKLCNEYDISLAIPTYCENASAYFEQPRDILEICSGRSRRIGVCANLGSWMRSGIDPVEATRILGDRLMLMEVNDLGELTGGHDVPKGTGVGRIGPLLEEVHRLGLKPTMFCFEYTHDGENSMLEITRSIEFFNSMSIQLAKRNQK